jgi:excisionase family DNA binding protein
MKPAANFEHSSMQTVGRPINANGHPLLLTVDEAAALLRTTRKAMYAMVERRQVPGVIRIGRRVLFRAADLLHWLDQKCAPSPKE